ncbi:hypothetical protein TrVE_jg9821 [Triparma verrucosa]|uniref:non-specific serine/threonine protein kinase n=1 Tax=Triparma verrucosa TaxID=1606542 RepID=A0A9W7C9F0_9STRA|nr:hypothetical protein TrVE_jg9821 [Triparma verrucosa]
MATTSYYASKQGFDTQTEVRGEMSSLYNLLVESTLNHLNLCLHSKSNKFSHDDLTVLSKIVTCIDVDHITALQKESVRSTDYLSPGSVCKPHEPFQYNPQNPFGLNVIPEDLHPASYLAAGTVDLLCSHCIKVLSSEDNVVLFQDTFATLTHILNHGSHYLVGVKGITIENLLSLLTDSRCKLTLAQQSKLLYLLLQTLAKYDRLTTSYASRLIPILLATVNQAKSNFALSTNEQLLLNSVRSLTAVLNRPGLPAVYEDDLTRVVRIVLGIAGKCDWANFVHLVTFLNAFGQYFPNSDLAWGVVEVVFEKRWEDGKRKRGGEDVVTKCAGLWVRIYEDGVATKRRRKQIKNGEYLLDSEGQSNSISPSASPSSPSQAPTDESIVSTVLLEKIDNPKLKLTRQIWCIIHNICTTNEAPEKYLDTRVIFDKATMALENNIFPANDEESNGLLWKIVEKLVNPSNYKQILPLLQLPRYESYQSSLYPVLARKANFDVGDGYGVEEVVRFVDVNVKVAGGGASRREKITKLIATEIREILIELAFHFEAKCIFSELKKLEQLSSKLQTLTLGGLHDPENWKIKLLFNSNLQLPDVSSPRPQSTSITTANVVTPTTTSNLQNLAISVLPSPPSDVYGPHYLTDTIIRLVLTANLKTTSELISAAVKMYTKNLPKLATTKPIFTRCSLLMRNILAYGMRLNLDLESKTEIKNLRNLYEGCRTLVSGFIFNPCEIEESQEEDDGFNDNVITSTPGVVSFGDGLSDDSEEEHDVSMTLSFTGTSKKQRVEKESLSPGAAKPQQRRKKSSEWVYPDSSSALLLVSILSILSPDRKTLDIVADSYVFPGETFDEKANESHLYHTESPFEILEICKMWTTSAGVLSDERLSTAKEDEMDNTETVPGLLVKMIRRAREMSPPSSPHHTCGYDLLAKLVEVGEGRFSAEDAEEIMSTVATNHKALRKSVKVREGLKAMQTKCMNSIYEWAEGPLLPLSKKLVTNYVFSNLCSLSELVRNQAVFSVGISFSQSSPSSQAEMARGLMASLPPLPLSDDEDVIEDAWREFSKNSCKDAKDRETMMHLRESMEETAIASLGEIVVCSSNVAVERQTFMTLLKLTATRPSLVVPLSKTLSAIAARKGYPSLKAFISDDLEYILKCWLDLGWELVSIPLIVCDPDVQLELLSCGLTQMEDENHEAVVAFTQHAPVREEVELDIEQLHLDSLHEFLHESAVMLIPIELTVVSREYKERSEGGKDEGFGWERLKETASLLLGNDSDESIAKLIRTYLHCIYGYVFPLINLEDNEKNQKLKDEGGEVLRTLQRMVSSDMVDRVTRKIPHQIVLRLLKLLSSRCFEDEDGERVIGNKAFFESIKWVADKCDGEGKSSSRKSIYAAASSSASEILLHLKNWFESAYTPATLKRHLMTLQHVLDTIIEEEGEGLGMAMCTVLALLEDEKFVTGESESTLVVLDMVEGLLTRIGEKGDSGSIEMVINNTVLVLINVYERETRKLDEKARDAETKFRVESIESIGLLGLEASRGGLWGWDGDQTGGGPSEASSRSRSKEEKEAEVVRLTVLKLLKSILLVNPVPPYLKDIDPLLPLPFVPLEDPLTAVLQEFESSRTRNNDVETALEDLRRFDRFCCRKSRRGGEDDTRSVIAMLGVVENAFELLDKLHGGGGLFLQDFIHYPLYYKALRHISGLCHRNMPRNIKVKAGEVVGRVGKWNWRGLGEGEGAMRALEGGKAINTRKITKEKHEDPMKALKSEILRNLGHYITGSKSTTALLAMETAHYVLATKDGGEVLKMLSRDEVARETLENIGSRGGNRKGHGVQNVGDIFHGTRRISCWDLKLWTCEDTTTEGYSRWICNLVTAIILCGYHNYDGTTRKKKKKSGVMDDDREATDGLDDFLGMCGSMSQKEANFAEAVFPAVVYDLLRKGAGSESVAWMVGSEESYTNRPLSLCFRHLLENPRTSPLALSSAISVLDFLRITTFNNFLLYGNHKKNAVSIKGKVYTEQPVASSSRRRSTTPDPAEEAKYNEGLGDPVEWEGLPYGCVLRLSGLDIASACLRARRPASALRYIEMYCDNVFGSSSDCLKNLGEARLRAVDGDVSGFGNHEMDDEWFKSKLIVLKEVLQKSYDMLGEDEAVIGVANSTIVLDMIDGNNTHSYYNDPMTRILKCDMKVSGGESSALGGLGRGLKELGMWSVMDGLLEGGKNDGELKELWHEGKWRAMNWDESLLRDGGIGDAGCEVLVPGRDAGYNELLHCCLGAAKENDSEIFGKSLIQAKELIAHEIGDTADGEGMLRTFFTSSVKLWSLLEVEGLGEVCFGSRVSELESNWKQWAAKCDDALPSFRGASSEGAVGIKRDLPFEQRNFINEVREVGMKIVLRNSRQQGSDEQALGVLLEFMDLRTQVATKDGFSREASGILERLVKAVGYARDSVKEGRWAEGGVLDEQQLEERYNFLRLKLHEAEILWAENDFMGATRLAKLIVDKENGKEGPSRDFLIKAMLRCGQWMAKSRTEGARNVLEKYLKPAVNLSRGARGGEEGFVDAAEAHLVLAEFVADGLDNIETRIGSLEWKKAKKAGEEREREYEACADMYDAKMAVFRKIPAAKSPGKNTQKSKELEADKKAKESELRDIHIHMRTLKKEIDMDKKSRASVESSAVEFLRHTLSNYQHGLSICGGEQDVTRHIFRFISIWLRNSDKEGVNKIMSRCADSIMSFVFVPLVYQLFSRVGTGGKEFQKALNSLVFKICTDHPHHGIVQLLTLANGANVGSGVSGRQSNTYLQNVQGGKSAAARGLIDQMKKKGGDLEKLISSMELLSTAYVNLAMSPTEKYHGSGKPKDISLSDVAGKNFVSLDKCLSGGSRSRMWGGPNVRLPAIFTMPPTLQKDGDYSLLIGSELVVGFEEKFQLTETGLHRPKIVHCIGESGKRYRQLVKGEDDIRQDAVMQQVFATVNRLLKGDEGAGHLLKISTYSVVPLSPTSGVLEWVLNTEPFGSFLLDQRARGSEGVGAHSRYYPGDWGNVLCRTHLKNASPSGKQAAYEEICKRFHPAFRFFFLERFSHETSAWHAARMNYSRSCAASSIVGHILGIGDRHTHNILISNKTGEVIHIDFGIVFEQGKVLTTPETIPFRLTRDMVDGMGVCGVEGVFSSSCNDVLRVLRANKETLLTILEVMTNDPLYKFLVSPVQKKKAQAERGEDDGDGSGTEDEEGDDDEEEGRGGGGIGNEFMTGSGEGGGGGEDDNDAATRALNKIASKLRGYEENVSESLSVEGQVSLLIGEARSVENLSKLYFGWAPWL